MMSVFNIFQTVGFYGFQNWVPTLLVAQGVEITKSLGYTTVIALAAPIGPLIGFFLGDRSSANMSIVGAAGAILVFGLIFGATRRRRDHRDGRRPDSSPATSCRTAFTPISRSCSRPAFAPAPSGFVYSWSRLSVIFSVLHHRVPAQDFGAPGVFAFIAGAMLVVMAVIGLFGPRTSNVALEKISH